MKRGYAGVYTGGKRKVGRGRWYIMIRDASCTGCKGWDGMVWYGIVWIGFGHCRRCLFVVLVVVLVVGWDI